MVCNAPIPAGRRRWKHAKFCNNKCRRKHEHAVSPHRSHYPHLNGAVVGALHELMVTCDLIKRGCQMFRAVSSSCDCDLAILKNKRLIRVEVTTGYKNKNGTIGWPKHEPELYDLLAVVCVDGIHYFPPDLLDGL